MRPTSVEVLRGLQGALISEIGPEVQSLFGQSAIEISQMLLEMLAQEADGAADNLARDNETLSVILGRGALAVRPLNGALADETEAALSEPGQPSLTITALSDRNGRLRDLLDSLLAACEGTEADPDEELASVRSEAYSHLREVAARGWSFWDVASFRERMARLRSSGT